MLFLILFQDWSGFSCSFHFSRFSCRLLRSSLASCVNLALIRSFVGVTLLDRLLECFSSPCVHELNMDCFPSNSCYFLFRVVLFFRHRIGKLLWAIFLLSFSHNFISNPFIFQNSHLSQLIHLLYILTAAFVLQMLCLLSARPSSASVINGCWRSPHSLSWYSGRSSHVLVKCPTDLFPTQTRRQWSRCSWRCVRAWAGPWSWPAGCSAPTLRGCCGLSGCCPTGCCTLAPSTLSETRRSTPSVTWTETAWGSTPVMSSMKPEPGNAPSWSQVKHFGWYRLLYLDCCLI